jgi:hypothetical protein
MTKAADLERSESSNSTPQLLLKTQTSIISEALEEAQSQDRQLKREASRLTGISFDCTVCYFPENCPFLGKFQKRILKASLSKRVSQSESLKASFLM